MEKRLQEFEIMRAFAIVIVLIHHLPSHTFNYFDLNYWGIKCDLTWLNSLNRYFALGIFFFISGYLLNNSNISVKNWKWVKIFLLKRFIRILPLYIISLLLFIIMAGSLINNMNIFCFGSHVFGLQILLASKFCEPIFTLWFIGLIVAYYYLFAILQLLKKNIPLFVFIVLTIPCIFTLLKYFINVTDKRFVVYYGIFLAGILSQKFCLLGRMKKSHILLCGSFLFLFIYLYGAVFFPMVYSGRVKPDPISFAGFGSLITVNVVMLCFSILAFVISKKISEFKNFKFVNILAYTSYCIFLFHRPVWWTMVRIYKPENDIAMLAYLGIIGIPIIVLVSYFLQNVYDKYSEKRLKKIIIKY